MAATFRLFGIPVRIDPWFLFGLFFVFSWSGAGQVGVFAAVGIGVLTLIHELGHAATARHFGCAVSIRLNLFVGWASYSAEQPLSRRQQVLISLAGPASQFGVGALAMVIVHQLFQGGSGDPQTLFNLWQGLSWAGIVIALINLLPLWPLDGGHVLHHVIGRFVKPLTALRATLVFTVVGLITLVVAAAGASNGWAYLADKRATGAADAAFAIQFSSPVRALWTQVTSFPAHLLHLPWFLVIFSGMATAQGFHQLSASKPRPSEPEPGTVDSALQAESRGWADGTTSGFPHGWSASPWLLAHEAAKRGDERGVAAALAQVVAGGRRWVLPDAAHPSLAPLLARLGPEPPVGELLPSLVLLRIVARHGSPTVLLDTATRIYSAHRSTEALLIAAAVLVVQGHPDDAMRWLERAMREAPDLRRLTTDPAYLPLQHRPDFDQLVADVKRRL